MEKIVVFHVLMLISGDETKFELAREYISDEQLSFAFIIFKHRTDIIHLDHICIFD